MLPVSNASTEAASAAAADAEPSVGFFSGHVRPRDGDGHKSRTEEGEEVRQVGEEEEKKKKERELKHRYIDAAEAPPPFTGRPELGLDPKVVRGVGVGWG